VADRPVRIAVDIGGTFTDLQVFDARTNRVHAWKTPTTPSDPSEGLMTGVREAAARFRFALADIGLLMHGTTIATNAVLERKLPVGALLTTKGFEDVLEIGRHVRRDIYGLAPDPFPTLISRDRRIGVPERILGSGEVEQALDIAALGDLPAQLDRADAKAVAIVLLNAFVNPEHEQRLRDWLVQRRPDLSVCISAEVSPEIREYERSSTTVLNALLMPVVRAYLERLEQRLGEGGFHPRVFLMQSNGGMCSLRQAAAHPARLLLSGPSGGALAVQRIATALDRPFAVGVDMGGTSFDVCVALRGQAAVIAQGEIDRLPVRLPMVEIRTIGAGGGSIASVDDGKRLTVGPSSAGAVPGPVAYRRGGTAPTVTDANLTLGRLDPAYFLGGAMALDAAAGRAAIERNVGAPLGLSAEQAAGGILTVTNANLAAAIRLCLFEKGLDPRDFSLISFGGAGGLHAVEVAQELGMPEVILPPDPGTLSAWGMLFCDLVQDIARSRVVRAESQSLPLLADLLRALRRQADELLDNDGIAAADRELRFAADMRYVGQAFELMVPWPEATATGAALDRLVQAFHAMHRQRFSYANPADAVEMVTLRASAIGRLPKPGPAAVSPQPGDARKGTRRVFAGGAWREVVVWDRSRLTEDSRVAGPAIVEEGFATHYVAEGWTAMLAKGAIIAVPA
jgi:N-methylhydantoinase A/oxoprolinase/acetone carboxylase beta subunit